MLVIFQVLLGCMASHRLVGKDGKLLRDDFVFLAAITDGQDKDQRPVRRENAKIQANYDNHSFLQ